MFTSIPHLSATGSFGTEDDIDAVLVKYDCVTDHTRHPASGWNRVHFPRVKL